MQDRALRPQSFDDFVGQAPLKANLKVFVAAAAGRKEAMDHVLFYGPPGLGKTTLAQIVARELGVGFRSTSGPVLAKAGDLAAILSNLEPNDVLFIDEIHRLSPVVEEILYPAMGGLCPRPDHRRRPGGAHRTHRPGAFTLVGATTRAGLLSTPLRDRFGIPLRLEFYTPEELVKVVMGAFAQDGRAPWPRTGPWRIASRSRGTPRIDRPAAAPGCAISPPPTAYPSLTKRTAGKALARLEVDQLGLDHSDRRYLRAPDRQLRRRAGRAGNPVGGDCRGTRRAVEDMIEPYLLQQGFIQRTQRGRMACARALSAPRPDAAAAAAGHAGPV
ncbi:MAG: Holliday junction branch migration DNA helicase RuvB [Asticcacaulis sp.]